MIHKARSKSAPLQRTTRVVRRFVAAINRHDVDTLASLMTEDHVFIDSLGRPMRGREAMSRAWSGYFAMVPDYRVLVRKIFVSGRTVMAAGTAAGSCVSPTSRTNLGNWEVPASWRAIVRGERVQEWQVYADNEPIRGLMRSERAE